MEIGGRLLPAGVNVAPCIYLMHRRADVYPDPLVFRPERFLEGQGGTYTWIPFGGGVRRCLGASFAQFEMRIVLQELASRLDLRAADPRPERMVRRAIILALPREGEIVAQRRAAADAAGASRDRRVSERPLTRKERQAHTRARLMRSAAKVAAARGLEGASLDLVAEEAGFTKGAVYANFESKEALFLAMLDERFAERLAELDRVLHGGGTIEEQARRGGRRLHRRDRRRARVGAALLRVRRLRRPQRGLPRGAGRALPRTARADRGAARGAGRRARHRAGDPAAPAWR